jgi:RimJ/RimL family protein N-acetyltransferase
VKGGILNDHDLMRIRADTLFTYDRRGRMLRGNELDGRPAPRLFLGYTTGGYVARFGESVPDALVWRVTEIIKNQPPVEDPRIPTEVLTTVREELERHTPVAAEESGPVYRFPESIERTGEVVQVTEANIAVVRTTYPWLERELNHWWPCFAVVRDGAAVSVCFSSRIGDKANEAGLDTRPAHRGRGYAAAVTAAWGATIREAGRIPLYSTHWDNLASQGVARRVGLVMFGADVSWA